MMFSPDFTQIGFDNDDGKRSLRADRRGIQERLLGSQVHEHHQRARRVQDLPRRQRGDDPLEREPHRDGRHGRPQERRHPPASRATGRARPVRPAAPTAWASASSRPSRTPAGAGRATTSAPRSSCRRRRPSRTAPARSSSTRSPGPRSSRCPTSSRPSRCSRSTRSRTRATPTRGRPRTTPRRCSTRSSRR